MLIELEPGTIFDDRYEVVELIAQGGMGSVYKARELELKRMVALKLLQPSLMVDSEYYNRFRQEGAVLSRLNHPSVVNFYRFGVFQEKIAYIVMELVDGDSLRRVLDQNGALPSARVAEIGIQTCRAMEAAHTQGVIHRDLKPDNIILLRDTDGEFVKVIDFGLARVLSGTPGQHLTQTGMLIGSVYYMSPEQCTGRPAEARSDVYSLGCVMYEAVTGRPPFSADNPIGLMSLHVNQTAPSISTLRSIPEAKSWDALLAKAMAKNPEDRYASMAELASALELLRAGKVVNSEPRQANRRAWRPNSLTAGVIALVGVLVITVGILAAIRHSDESKLEVLKSNQARITRPVATKLSPEWIYEYRLRREKLSPGDEISALRSWIRQFGSADPDGVAIAHFWICLEHVGNASDITYSRLNHGTRYTVPARNVCVGEAQRAREDALKLIRKSLKAKPKSPVDRLSMMFYERVLVALDRSDSDRIKMCQAMLRKSDDLGPKFSHELRGELIRIYRRSGDFAAEAKVLQDLLDDTSTPSLMMAENYLRQGQRAKAHARLTAELNDMTHNRWSQFNKRLIHYCGQLLFVEGQFDAALTACRFCQEDARLRTTDDAWLRDTRVCMDAADHAVIEASALHALKKDKQAEQALKRTDFSDIFRRIRKLPTTVNLGRQLGIDPMFFLRPVLQAELVDEDVRWLAVLSDQMRSYDPDTASILVAKAMQLMNGSLQKSVVKIYLLESAVSMLSNAGKYDEERALIDTAISKLSPDDQSERRLVFELLLVRSLIDCQRYDEAQRRLAPLIKQVRSEDFKFSQECVVQAVSLEARLYLIRHREAEARRLYLELFNKYRHSHDLSVEQKLELIESLESLSHRPGDSSTVTVCRSEREKLKLPGLDPLIDLECTR